MDSGAAIIRYNYFSNIFNNEKIWTEKRKKIGIVALSSAVLLRGDSQKL